MNYQYANGGTLTNAITTLYKEGGVPRSPRRLVRDHPEPPEPVRRHRGEHGILVALGELAPNMPVAQTAFPSLGGSELASPLPVDTLKTTLQVQGCRRWPFSRTRSGPAASACCTARGGDRGELGGQLPVVRHLQLPPGQRPQVRRVKGLARNAFIDMCASFVSDCVSNSLES